MMDTELGSRALYTVQLLRNMLQMLYLIYQGVQVGFEGYKDMQKGGWVGGGWWEGWTPDCALGWDSCSWMSLATIDADLGFCALYTMQLLRDALQMLCLVYQGVQVGFEGFKDTEKGGK